MILTSPVYNAQNKRNIAPPCFVRIVFGLTDTDAASTATIAATSPSTYFSYANSLLLEDGVPGATYATWEPGRLKADGKQLMLPNITPVLPHGYISAALCGADGAFAPAITLHFTFSKKHTVPGLTFTFDETCNEYPASFTLLASGDGQTLLQKTYAPDNATFTTNDEITGFDALTLTVHAMHTPHRRFRLQQLMFGYGLTFENNVLQTVTQHIECDPLSRRLPINTLQFTLANVNTLTGEGGQYLYNPDNAAGIYQYISAQNPLTISYGQMLDAGITWQDAAASTWDAFEKVTWQEIYKGGIVEWVNGGRYYLTGEPSVDGLSAKFSAQDALSALSGTYEKGVYQTQSLYALAQAVLEDAAITRLSPYQLWDGLKDITTTAPLPTRTHKELLQLIAHAGMCALYTNRAGEICIMPQTQTTPQDTVSFSEMLSLPKVTQIPTLAAVDCLCYTYTPETESELYSGYLAKGTHTISYSPATDITVNADAIVYASCAQITMHTAGEVVITGKKLATHTQTARHVSYDENGETELVDNPLVTSYAHAQRLASWVNDWLQYRNTYQFPARGAPQYECGDCLNLESQFTHGALPARILSHEITFHGGLTSHLTAKRMVNA